MVTQTSPTDRGVPLTERVAAEREFFRPMSAAELDGYQVYLRRLLEGRWPPRAAK